ncbi:MAG: hypothetical protein NTX59_09535 [Elusimicrobia bacterium]|nr:hypothetical protein [Elusimicrobiota bacterium]
MAMDRKRRWGVALLISLVVPPILYLGCGLVSDFMGKVLWGSDAWASSSYVFLGEAGLMFAACFVPGILAGRWCGGPGFLLLPSTFFGFLFKALSYSSTNSKFFTVMMWLAGAVPSLLLAISIGAFLRRRAEKSRLKTAVTGKE